MNQPNLIKPAFLLLLFCLLSNRSLAQHARSIKGSLTDTASNAALSNATVYVLRAKDSIICSYSYTRPDGSFSVTGLPEGKLILLASYPDYADYVEPFTVDDVPTVRDFGRLNLQQKSRLLQEVLIKGQVTAIRIKGDTTEFNAKAYTIQPNDKVEDLLKQLPGLQVDKDGKITANGERVTRVLLDGEEFFGDDPTLVTRNIRADIVDKVQLYDKKSDQATFTSIDDGVKTKTLNVKLREDKNSGTFGKLEAGIGTAELYSSQALLNKFKPGEKFAAYATAATTGKLNLGIGDNNRIGAGGNTALLVDVVALPSMGTDDQDGFNGQYNGRGLPVARTGGVHYDDKWNGDKETINANYKAGYLSVNSQNNVFTDRNLPAGLISSTTSRNAVNEAFRQKLDAAYTVKLDSTANLKIALEGTLKNTTNTSDNSSRNLQDDRLLSQNTNLLSGTNNLTAFAGSVFYSRRFRKPGRSFSWSLGASSTDTHTDGTQHSVLNFYNPAGGTDSVQRIDQTRIVDLQNTGFSSNLAISESLSKTFAIVLNYGTAYMHSIADRSTFKPSSPGNYDQLDPAFSNNYRFNQLVNQAGAIFNYHRDKTTLNFGTKASLVDYRQLDRNTSTTYRRSFINWSPQLNYQYKISQQKNLAVTYNGNSGQPTIDQLQPVLVNTDPLNILSGNPDLAPSFNHRMTFRYRSYAQLSGTLINVSGSYGMNPNAIVYNSFTESSGRTTLRFSNLDGRVPVTYGLSTNIGTRIKPLDVYAELELFVNGSESYNYNNYLLNKSTRQVYWSSLMLQKNVQRKYGFQVVVGPNYTVNRFSFQRTNNNAAGFYLTGNGSVYLSPKVQLFSDFAYDHAAGTRTLPSRNQSIWNASLSKTFLEGDALKLSLSGNDLLNQNQNFSRSVSANTITQSSFNNIRRNFMVSLSWDFSKFGAATSKK